MDELGSPNVDVIVSDHHHTKGSCPEAYAFINPQRPDDNFKDKTICGCVVALCLMTQTAKVMAAGYFGGKRPSGSTYDVREFSYGRGLRFASKWI